MNNKLTLSVDGELIRKAKTYASDQGRSVSDMVESYLKALTMEGDEAPREISPLVKSMKGSFSAPKGFNGKQALTQALAAKHKLDEPGAD